MTARTLEQLKLEYADDVWRARFVDFCDLIDILADCIIADDFVVSDDLNAVIRLSDAGNNLLDRLTRKERVNAKDARMMCALSLGHDELFVDIEGIDLSKLSAAIHAELLDDSLRFPFSWGRDLYDKFSVLHEDERDVLTTAETQRLLNELPRGVFQYGRYTVGPFGLRESGSRRRIPGRRRVGAYHCPVSSCQTVHSVALQTSSVASINRDREKLETILESWANEPAEWSEFAGFISGNGDAYYGDQRAGVLLPLIGDTFTDKELRALVDALLDSKESDLRDAVKSFLEVRTASDTTAALVRAELLQLVLIAREDSIGPAIDKLVRRGIIDVPRGDIRRPVINRLARSGAFRLRAELGYHGVRFVSDDPGLALLRQRRMLRHLYLSDSEADVQELEWQLRGIDVDDLDERVEHFFQTRSPQQALSRLVLARKTNMITACHEVGLEVDDEIPDDELVEGLLWKLGFPIHSEDDPHSEFWRLHERLWALTQSSSIGSSNRFREAAAPYFAQLEGLLVDALAFTSWALLVDHTSNEAPFAYDDLDDRSQGLALLQAIVNAGSDSRAPDYTDERVELKNLIEGFRTLSKHLKSIRELPEMYVRPEQEMPSYDGKTDLKTFLLRSTVPFLDLSRASQERIIDGLFGISRAMVEAEVSSVRNDYIHYRRTGPDIARMEVALEAVRQSVTRMENLGFCRLLFVPAGVETDRWGQSRHEFVGPRSYEHAFGRPTNLDWMGLPRLTEPQYLMRAASFGDPNEVLRFTRRFDSSFAHMWIGFPIRRRSGAGNPSVDEQPSHQTDVETAST